MKQIFYMLLVMAVFVVLRVYLEDEIYALVIKPSQSSHLHDKVFEEFQATLATTVAHANVTHESKAATFQETLVQQAREAANCQKTSENSTFVVCDRLPFTEISCGDGVHDPERDSIGREYLVPNIVHMIWIGGKYEMKSFHHYLAIRSVASIQRPTAIYFHHSWEENDIVETELWKRIKKEIPCLKFKKIVDLPLHVYKSQPVSNICKSDYYRLLTIQEMGGVYMDLDVITAKSYDPIRIHPFTMGRSVRKAVSSGILLAQAHANFTAAWLDKYHDVNPSKCPPKAIKTPYRLYSTGNPMHIEKLSMNRPNPFIDGGTATTSSNFDISDNYFLHIHPSHRKTSTEVLEADEDEIRIMDNVYGAAARAALFGSQDFVFLKGEETRERTKPKKLAKYLD